MTKTVRIVLGVLLLAGIAASFFWQRTTIGRLESESAVLREQAAQLEALREENSRLAGAQTNSAELQRLRADQSELLRLRSEVTLLRGQLKDALARRAVPAPAPQTSPAGEQPSATASVETYVAAVQATVPWKQTLVTGGWTMPSGKRALVFVQPQMYGDGGQAGQILLQTRILEMPDEVLNQMGLQGLRSDSKQSSSQALLTAEQADAIMKTLDKTAGVNVLSAPKITTLDGRQAQIKSTEVKTLPSGEKYEVGPIVDITPQISADRASVNLNISAQLRQPSAKSP